MTTTIKYGNSTIATAENQTKTLLTANKYVGNNIEITDMSSGGGFTADQIAMHTISGDISGSATHIGSYAFNYCDSLTTVYFPNVTNISGYAFRDCYSLTTASFPSATSIGSSAFQYCYNLLSFYLLGSSIPTLGTSVFNSTPIGGYTTSTSGVYGSIFVPSSLYNQYIAATNWSAYSSRIVSV